MGRIPQQELGEILYDIAARKGLAHKGAQGKGRAEHLAPAAEAIGIMQRLLLQALDVIAVQIAVILAQFHRLCVIGHQPLCMGAHIGDQADVSGQIGEIPGQDVLQQDGIDHLEMFGRNHRDIRIGSGNAFGNLGKAHVPLGGLGFDRKGLGQRDVIGGGGIEYLHRGAGDRPRRQRILNGGTAGFTVPQMKYKLLDHIRLSYCLDLAICALIKARTSGATRVSIIS